MPKCATLWYYFHMYPTLFGFLESYTVMIVLGVIVALVIFELFFRKCLKEPGGKVYYVELSLLISIAIGIIGAYLTQNLYDFIQDPAHYSWSWTLTFYGGFIFGVGTFILLYFVWVRKHYPEALEKLFWIFPACIALAHAIGRIGCFLAGCCYGVETHEWFGVHFQTTDTTVVPTNLFEAIFLFVLGGGLALLAFKKKSPYGLSIYAVAYGIWRFSIEFVRGDYRGTFIPGITPSQFWSILLVLFGIGYFLFRFFYLNKRIAAKKESDETSN